MLTIVLDAYYLDEVPFVLAKEIEGHKVVIPQALVDWLNEQATDSEHFTKLVGLVKKAEEQYIIDIAPKPTSPESNTVFVPESAKSHLGDIIQVAADLKSKVGAGDEVNVATSNALLDSMCRLNGIKPISLLDLKSKYKAAAKNAHPELEKIASQIKGGKIFNVIFQIILAFALAGLLYFLYLQFETIFSGITAWGVLSLLLVAGVLLYMLRGRYIFIYGMAEIAIGVITAAGLLLSEKDASINYTAFEGASFLKLAASLYIIVRGLDNFGKGLEVVKPSWAERWERVFFGLNSTTR
jgi:hypothetical protein